MNYNFPTKRKKLLFNKITSDNTETYFLSDGLSVFLFWHNSCIIYGETYKKGD